MRIGVVSFLNSKPLIEGLAVDGDVACVFDVPARLAERLSRREVDAALIPVVDVLRARGRLRVLSDACIASDGETMTVRVFSPVPPDRITRLRADVDSHTSVALARVLWRALYERELDIEPLDTSAPTLPTDTPVLLIGDKVISPARGGFAYEVDLGGAWRELTGLPFVFAVWAAHADALSGAAVGGPKPDDYWRLAGKLMAARDRGVEMAADLAASWGPRLGWPAPLAERYLVRCLRFRLDARTVAGAERFAALCAAEGLVPADATLPWPTDLLTEQETSA